MKQLSNTAVQAMTAAETNAVLLHILTIEIDNLPILRVVDDKRPLVSNTNEYTPCAFTIVLPDHSSDDTNKACKLKIDNIDLAIMREIKKTASGHAITATIAIVLSNTPDVYERGPLRFILRNVTATKSDITGELYDFYLYDRRFSALTYSPQDFPGLFF